MSMDEMLLNELYGSEEVQQEEQIKQAQVELVEAVAAEAGVNLSELDDEELTKFAHYVLSDEDELTYAEESFESEADLDKLAALEQADLMGRQMAHSYADELISMEQGDQMYYQDDLYDDLHEEGVHTKIASAMEDVAEAFFMQKLAEEGDNSGRNALIAAGGGAALAGGAGLAAKAYGDRRLNRLNQAATAYGNERATALNKALKQAGEKTRADGSKYMTSSIQGRLNMAQKQIDLMENAVKTPGLQKNKRYGKRMGILQKGLAKAQADKAALIKKMESDPDHLKKIQQMSADRRAEMSGFGQKLRNLSGKQIAGLGLGGAALAGGGAYLLSRRNKQEKSAALAEYGYEALALANLYEPEEFAKEAEFRAAEILLANGVDPETFEDVYPEEVKLASFPGIEDAVDYDEALALEEYNDMLDSAAVHIIESIMD